MHVKEKFLAKQKVIHEKKVSRGRLVQKGWYSEAEMAETLKWKPPFSYK